MAKELFTHDRMPEFCQPIEVDIDGRTMKAEYHGFVFSRAGANHLFWEIKRMDGKTMPVEAQGVFTSIAECTRQVDAMVNSVAARAN